MKFDAPVIIAGHGRSGTNWLLEILDHSPRAHCRNEPDECAGSALEGLPRGLVASPALNARLEAEWDERAARAGWSFGARDHRPPVAKDHFSRLAQRTGLLRLAQAKKPRRALGRLTAGPGREEWPVPGWVARQNGAGPVVPVLKINMAPGWIAWALRRRPETRVVHIVRHPGGFLNSLMKRLWAQLDIDAVTRDNRDRLERVAEADPVWAGRIGDLGPLSTVELELWYWRYACETIHEAGATTGRYQLVIYEDLARGPLKVCRSIYQGCGLAWDATISEAIGRASNESQSIAAAWERKLQPEHVAAVRRVLEGSLMQDWWDKHERGGAAAGPSPEPEAGASPERGAAAAVMEAGTP